MLWSDSADRPPEHYVLLTVTYGETCAPYLAIRTLKQLSADDGNKYPDAADAIERELYVDDFLSGGHDIPLAKRRRHQLITLLKAGGFVLKKWVANEALLLEDVPSEDRLRSSWMQFSTEGPVKDHFTFISPAAEVEDPLTKRRALAELARVFDPLGWLAPVTLTAKFVIQDLWRAKLTWDEELPRPWADKCNGIRGSLSSMSGLVIPRWLGFTPGRAIQLHAFSDASRRAMAGVVYSRTTSDGERPTVSILGAKTKLASIRSLQPSARAPARMTIPRLELRAALFASRLLVALTHTLDVPLSDCHLWSDSSIVLSWIQSDKPVGNELVDNYVAQIHEFSSGATWHHVPTRDNPADIASRGTDTSKLESAKLWWNGPHWLTEDESRWPLSPVHAPHPPFNEDDVTAQPPTLCVTTQTHSPTPHHIDRFSSLSSLLRDTVRARRLLRSQRGTASDHLPAPMMPMTAAELRRAFVDCVKLTQALAFAQELADQRPSSLHAHTRSHGLPRHRALRPLAPFVDEDGVLRAGGRLTYSSLPYDERHPPILDGSTHLAKLIVRWAHERSLHSGFRATYAWTLHKAWIINAKVLVKKHIRECTLCARIAAHTATQGMAPLPAARVTVPSRPFERCGLDYAGPFQVLRSKGRGVSSHKGYITLFVCLSTKAIHLELVGDLSTASFLGALTRFIGRRGRPTEIGSDNGTNFRGANHEIQRLLKAAEMDWGLIEGHLAHEGITWRFIPPSAPHFGGLWEAGVKSTKMHLRRDAGPRRLTYEEFSTLLISVEAILNTRPLAPPSGDLSDLDALTPSHFLIGTSGTSLLQPADPNVNLEHTTHWDLVKGMRDRYWARWSREYLNTLLQRPKWRRPQPNFKVGDFIVIVDASLLRPHGQWPMGRIIVVHPGADGLVRTVTVRTATGEYVRSIVKLARLPLTAPPVDVPPPTNPVGN